MKNKEVIFEKIDIEKHFGLVHLCCQRFRKHGVEYDDMFQSGCIGLTKAAKNFDPARGVKFSTYAVPAILGEIRLLFRENGYLKVSRKLKDLGIKINYERENFIKSHEREPTINELSQKLNIDSEQIIEAVEISKTPISLSSLGANSEKRNADIDIPVFFDDEKISIKISLIQIFKTLENKDKKLIYLRFFRGETQTKIAKVLGMTQVQVSRREKALLKFIRGKLK
ncbi:MAG: sigma-70 family RNA polymerase sigma factor [Clostridia bacterium]|nr:sigma-70 family RNA polymerase sigma factor [Clostridia bacterium]